MRLWGIGQYKKELQKDVKKEICSRIKATQEEYKVEREILTKTNKKSNPCISQLKIPSERTAGLFGTCQTPTQITKIQLTLS